MLLNKFSLARSAAQRHRLALAVLNDAYRRVASTETVWTTLVRGVVA